MADDANTTEEEKDSQNGELEEEIIVEEPEGSDQGEDTQEQEELEAQRKKKRMLFFALIGMGTVVLILLVVLLLVIFSEGEAKKYNDINNTGIVENLQEDKKQLQTKLEDMIKKANILYSQGKKREALNLYEHIANFSKSISYYNLGVAQMKKFQYKDALKSFQTAITNQEHRTISALNSAVCALKLNDKKLFDYYIDLAYAYLSDEAGSKLYNYLYSVINYYKNNKFELLASAAHAKSEYYTPQLHRLNAYAFLEFGGFYKAIEELEKTGDPIDNFRLGLSYANIGDYAIAKKYLEEAVKDGYYPKLSKAALSLVELQNRNFQSASENINELRSIYGEDAIKGLYPIEVQLSDDLYDKTKVQKTFMEHFQKNRELSYKLLFNYAPYKVFNANQTLNFIKKGSGTIFIDEVDSATTYLSKSGTVSKVNVQLSKAIRLALDKRVSKANAMLKGLLDEYQNHSILHYNLALTYAQMEDFIKAHEHFTRSYHLDASNYMSGIFALMSAELIKKDVEKLRSIILDDLRREPESEKTDFYNTLVELMNNNVSALISWSEQKQKSTPLNVALKVVTYLNFSNQSELMKYTNRLKKITEGDVLSQLLHLYAGNYHLDIKTFASKVQQYLNAGKMDLNEIYHGAKLPMDTYIDFANVSGNLFELKEKLEAALLRTDDPKGVMYALSKVNILLKNYESAYTMMNELIDKYDVKDAHTLFLAAVASIAADHHANAVVLLRLASLKDGNNYESRYGLGLLYHEMKNLEGAAIQYGNIQGKGLRPKYLDFKVTGENIVRGGG